MERLETHALDLDKDERLGKFAYAKQVAWLLSPLIAAVGFIAAGRLTGQKLPFLNGHAPLLLWMQEKGALFVGKRAGMESVKDAVKNIEKLSHAERQFLRYPYLPLKIADDVNNAIRGFEFGSILLGYRLWTQKEGKRLDLVPTLDRLKKLDYKKPTDDELRAENESLKAQIEFLERPDAQAKLHNVPQGKIEALSHEHAGMLAENNALLAQK